MKEIGRAEGISWVVLGAFFCVLSWRISIGSFREPGPGFISLASGLSLIIIGLIMMLLRTFSRSSPVVDEHRSRSILRLPRARLMYTVILLVGYALFLDLLGYLVATFLVMVGLFFDRGANRLLPSILASLVTVGVTYLLFEIWLRCQLPRGIFPWW